MITPTGCRWTLGGRYVGSVEGEGQAQNETVTVGRVHEVSEKDFGDGVEFDQGRGRNRVEEKAGQDCL